MRKKKESPKRKRRARQESGGAEILDAAPQEPSFVVGACLLPWLQAVCESDLLQAECIAKRIATVHELAYGWKPEELPESLRVIQSRVVIRLDAASAQFGKAFASV